MSLEPCSLIELDEVIKPTMKTTTANNLTTNKIAQTNTKTVIEMIRMKRIYEPADKKDQCRILVDRLWPRGVSKEEARVDLWLKEIAPSDELRKWFAHDPIKWEEFKKRYAKELEAKQNIIQEIRQMENEAGTVTLLYSAKDTEHNNAMALKAILERKGFK
jgi:uncharacterized protein YeaO (DUF488 family)